MITPCPHCNARDFLHPLHHPFCMTCYTHSIERAGESDLQQLLTQVPPEEYARLVQEACEFAALNARLPPSQPEATLAPEHPIHA